MLFKMLTGAYPFTSQKNKSLMKEILQNKIHYPFNMKLHHVVLLKKMLNKDPDKRLSVRGLLNYMKQI